MRILSFFFLIFIVGCSQGKWFSGFNSPKEDWQVKQVRSKWNFGPEFRHSNDKDNIRWSVGIGLETELYNGQKFGVSYRRRDVSETEGWSAHDNGVWLEWSFPIWTDESRR